MREPISFTVLGSPVGELLLVKRNNTLVRVSYLEHAASLSDELFKLGEHFREDLERHDEDFAMEAAQFDEYFAGKRKRFKLKFDLLLTKGFMREALTQVLDVPYGETASYGEIAIRAGSPNAYRAAGTACGHNPLVLIIPCHRVIKADGTIGDYGSAGRERKAILLKLEATHSFI